MQADMNNVLTDRANERQKALARWDNEGGAEPGGIQDESISSEGIGENRALTNAETAQLHVRVIALENIVIALLAESSDRHLQLARDMAAYILPRPGYRRHPATVHASAQMVHLLHRASLFHGLPLCPDKF